MATTILITGANRGIGRSFTEQYLLRPNHTVIAAVRNPDAPDSQALKTLPAAEGSKFLLVKIDSLSDTDPAAAVEAIKAAGVTHLDVVIANAGITSYNEPVHAMDFVMLRNMMEVNAFGPVKLFTATRDLLSHAKEPKFFAVSSILGSTAEVENNGGYHLAGYGASKAAVNHLVRRMHWENEWLTALTAHPGVVMTDMAAAAVEVYGDAAKGDITAHDSVKGMIKLIDQASRTSVEGKHGFMNVDGATMRY